MMMKTKTCKSCKQKFRPERQMQQVCSYECAITHTNELQHKKKQEVSKTINKEKKEHRANDRVILKQLAQKLVNQYARMRDERERGLVCCTCGHRDSGQFDGGHFLPTSGYSAIRYNTNQIHLQCKRCNRFNGGMPKEYRLFMINRYGLEYVENLEATKTKTVLYPTEYYQKLIRVVRKKIRRLGKSTL